MAPPACCRTRPRWRQPARLRAAGLRVLLAFLAAGLGVVLRAAGLPAISEDWADKHYLTKNIATLGSETSVLGGAEGGNA